jgi:hypothetical protein
VALSRRRRTALLVALLVLLVNLPLLVSLTTAWRVERRGVYVVADVAGTTVDGAGPGASFLVFYRLPEELDPGRPTHSARVTRQAYDDAAASKTIGVRLLESRPGAARVDGQIRGRAGLWSTLVADALLLMLLLVVGRRGRYGRLEVLRLEARTAVGPVSATDALGIGEGQDDGTCWVRGVVVDQDDHEVVLDTGERRVRVILDGRDPQVGPGDPAEVRGRLL